MTWHDAVSAAVMLGRDAHGLAGFGPVVTRWDSYLAVGDVRLDNRPNVLRWAGLHPAAAGDASDLELVVRAIAQQGSGVVPRLLGDFAFVVWDVTSRRLVAARDAFGVRRLCYHEGTQRIAFSSLAELLAEGDAYDIQPFVEMIAMCDPSPDRTVYAGVRAVPPATLLRGRAGALTTHEYWAPEAFEPTSVAPGREEECMRPSVGSSWTLCGSGSQGRPTSGRSSRAAWIPRRWSAWRVGLPSVASCRMACRGRSLGCIAGAPTGIERVFSNAVAQHWDLRNEVMLNDWYWEDDGEEPPLTDQPDPEYPSYARERRAARTILNTGGRVLLTGYGSDQYMLGNMLFFRGLDHARPTRGFVPGDAAPSGVGQGIGVDSGVPARECYRSCPAPYAGVSCRAGARRCGYPPGLSAASA